MCLLQGNIQIQKGKMCKTQLNDQEKPLSTGTILQIKSYTIFHRILSNLKFSILNLPPISMLKAVCTFKFEDQLND